MFLLPDGITGEILDAYELYKQITSPYSPEFAKEFLSKHSNWTFIPRPISNTPISKSQVDSGDYIGKMVLGGQGIITAYGTGGHTEHAAVASWIGNELYVFESDITIRKTEWSQWLANQPTHSMIILAKLKPELRHSFNLSAALDYFESVQQTPYGWQNSIWGWIDTPSQNWPPPSTVQLVPVFFSLVDRIRPELARLLWGEALNKRLNTHGLTTEEMIPVLQRRSMRWGMLPFDTMLFFLFFYLVFLVGDLFSIPEQDDWYLLIL